MGKLESKPVSWFKTKPQARKTFNEAELLLLGESLKVKQLQPVVARPDGTIIAGERRLRAASLVRMTHLQVIITDEDLSESEIKILALTENLLRSDLRAEEKWRACCELMEIHTDWSCADLAGHLKIDPSSVTRLLSPSKTIGEVQEAFKNGLIGLSDCYAISKLDSPAEQAELLALKLGGASRDTLEQVGRSKRQANVPAVRTARLKCPLPTGVCLTFSGKELSLAEAAEALGEATRAIKKAMAEGLDARTWSSVMSQKAKAGQLV